MNEADSSYSSISDGQEGHRKHYDTQKPTDKSFEIEEVGEFKNNQSERKDGHHSSAHHNYNDNNTIAKHDTERSPNSHVRNSHRSKIPDRNRMAFLSQPKKVKLLNSSSFRYPKRRNEKLKEGLLWEVSFILSQNTPSS